MKVYFDFVEHHRRLGLAGAGAHGARPVTGHVSIDERLRQELLHVGLGANLPQVCCELAWQRVSHPLQTCIM